jgi:hypothetical protein
LRITSPVKTSSWRSADAPPRQAAWLTEAVGVLLAVFRRQIEADEHFQSRLPKRQRVQATTQKVTGSAPDALTSML